MMLSIGVSTFVTRIIVFSTAAISVLTSILLLMAIRADDVEYCERRHKEHFSEIP